MEIYDWNYQKTIAKSLLCSGYRYLLTLFQIPIYISIDGSNFSKHFTVLDLYYLYCLSIFQRTLRFLNRFVSKAGAKVKDFFITTKCFWKFFLVFFSEDYLTALLRKEKKPAKKKTPFICESDCKDKNFFIYIPKLFGSFFCSWVKQSCALSLSHFHQGFLLSESGCKSTPFQDTKQIYITLFSDYFFIIWLTCWLIGCFKNTAVSIQEATKGRIQNYTHYYI